MKSKLLLLAFITPICLNASAQESRVAYAITGQGNGSMYWSDIRSLDMRSGSALSTLFANGTTNFTFVDAGTGRLVESSSFLGSATGGTGQGTSPQAVSAAYGFPSPTALMSAAVAYDKWHGKLFFATMKTGQLVWMDLQHASGTPVFYTTQKPLVQQADPNDEAFNITRMTIGADGNGYALTNDANHLVRFTTGNKMVATDLGSLIDDGAGPGLSVHNKCSSWGGDIVADAYGRLYLFTASKNVFVIDPQTLITTYRGTVTGLPGTFSVNGAAVVDDQHVIVSTANSFDGFYSVDMNNLAGTRLNTDGPVYNASDLASGNLLYAAEKNSASVTPELPPAEVMGNALITIYPNPVDNNQVKITFAGNVSGKYLIQLADLQGRIVESTEKIVKSPGEIAEFRFQRKQPGGLYMIKITDDARRTIYSDKIMIE